MAIRFVDEAVLTDPLRLMPAQEVLTTSINKPVHEKPKRSGDRHSPGYMREYMRKRRAARRMGNV